MDYAVRVEDLTVAYADKPVLWDVDLEFPRGKLTAIVGPNGAGKSTLIKAMMDLVPIATGRITFNLGDTGAVDKKRIGYVPQNKSIDWDFPATVFDVVLMGRYGHLGWLKRPSKEDKRLAKEALQKVGMEDYANRQISQLSGGQQQRVFLARALCQQAELYFLDEPFKGVDVSTEETIIRLLKELRDEGKTVIMVHHDLNKIKEYFDWLVLVNVSVKADGPVAEVFTEENLQKAYGVSKPIQIDRC